MEAQTIAYTILEQINAIDPAALLAYGSTTFKVLPEQYIGKDYYLGGISFNVRGLQFKGEVKILLHANDTYTIIFGESWRYDNVYFDNLISHLDYIEFGHKPHVYTSADIFQSLFDEDND